MNPEQAALRDFRKVPVPRLAIKLGIDKYMDMHPEFMGILLQPKVSIPLGQHIGAPAQAVVKKGATVPGDCIGEIPQGALGARVHASLDGEVVDGTEIVSSRERRHGDQTASSGHDRVQQHRRWASRQPTTWSRRPRWNRS
jgi:Na+-translocating ferredoxin:NAD+ oxidoreductase RnfC subunit